MKERITTFFNTFLSDIENFKRIIIKNTTKILTYKNAVIFLLFPVVFSLFFWLYLKPPFAQYQDIAVIYLLIMFFSAFLTFTITFKELKKFIFYQILPYFIIVSEMMNFELYTQFDVENAIRYGLTLSLLAMLTDIGVTIILTSLNLNKTSAVISAFLQIFSLAPFAGVLSRNIFGKSHIELETVTAIYQTDLTEALSYIAGHANIMFAIIFLIILSSFCIYWYIKLPQFKITTNLLYRLIIIIICMSITYGTIYSIRKCYRKNKLWLFSILNKGAAFKQELVIFNQKAAQRRLQALSPQESQKVVSKGNNGRFILILGESNSRDYMNCYGYKNNTTPFLSKMKSDKRFIFFSQVYANHVHTTEALKYLLSEKNQYNNRTDLGVTIFDVLRYCKYKSYFISNQYVYDCLTSPVSAISQAADYINYINTEMDFIVRKNRLDIEAINALKKLKLEDRSIAIIHLMSCHAPYQVRYPADFRYDLSKRYERAMAYLDYVLENFFEYAIQNDFIDGVIFIPDHGEDVTLGDHDSAIFTPDMTRIPMICYLSESYIKNNPQLYKKLQAVKDKVFTNDLIFDFMLDFMGIKTLFNQSKLHLLADDYSIDMNIARTLHGKAKLESKIIKK